MKTAKVLRLVREAIRCAHMKEAEFGDICRRQGRGHIDPVRNAAGDIVTEANVSDFIRERVAAHHHCWIIGNLESVAQELQGSVQHEFVIDVHYLAAERCVQCGLPASHRSHRK